MRADAPEASRPAPTVPETRPGARRGAFGAALVLAGARGRGELAPDMGPAVAPAPLTLVRRRSDADEAQRKLAARREEAKPGKGGTAGPLEARARPACGDPGRSEAPTAGTLVPASAVERLALEVSRTAGRPAVEMSFGRDLHVRITRSARGVELLLAPRAELRSAAVAELPGLVAALRARGVRVEKAEVRPSGAAATGASRPRRHLQARSE